MLPTPPNWAHRAKAESIPLPLHRAGRHAPRAKALQPLGSLRSALSRPAKRLPGPTPGGANRSGSARHDFHRSAAIAWPTRCAFDHCRHQRLEPDAGLWPGKQQARTVAHHRLARHAVAEFRCSLHWAGIRRQQCSCPAIYAQQGRSRGWWPSRRGLRNGSLRRRRRNSPIRTPTVMPCTRPLGRY